MPPASATAPSQSASGNSARNLAGMQRIAAGGSVAPLPLASQPVDLLGVTFLDGEGKSCN